jgi:toxin ParE1/3/4
VRQVTLHRLAEEEMLAAAAFYNEQALGLGRAFLLEVEQSISRANETPRAGTQVRGQIRRWPVRRFPFNVLYSTTEEEFKVVAIMHKRRRPDYWQSRLP